MRRIMLAAATTIVATASLASAESARMTALFPAGNSRIAMFKTIGIDNFSGREGSKLAFELERNLTRPFDGNAAYFKLLADGSAPDGIVRGNASSAVTETPYQRRETICTAKAPDGKCITQSEQTVNCMRRVVEFSADISVVDNGSGEIVFSQQFPRRNEISWCAGQQAWTTIEQVVNTMLADVATQFRKIATPSMETYSVRYQESTEGLDAPAKASFKNAIRLTKTDAIAACRIFDELIWYNPGSFAIAYNQGVCDEIQHNYPLGWLHYGNAAKLAAGRDDVAKALDRVAKLNAALELAKKRG